MASTSRLLAIMAKLREPVTGCSWDIAQDFASIAPYTIEEAYEVADAIARNDLASLKDELGDLLLQVVFHARIAEDIGAFDFTDVATAISDKMERRHPHIFGNDGAPVDANTQWEAIKAEERAFSGDTSALAGVALALPALMRAEKIQKRAARAGFDWPDAEGPRAKVLEELDEVTAAANEAEREDEIGDLLFAVVNLARHLKIDSEVALRRANAKFERRFRAIEVVPGFAGLSLEAKESLWAIAKIDQRALD
ncbi:nucleoside triphosphate pyrophosphohydrolase [Sphingomonas paeninsulae]|jgi:ATP diphosphatase|uniref:Nucleoside triphosphate pyrophosphohydrolase n=1 Tax=Sphingomonas paeninsulae TaxID=2319844 RepID=A0A494TKL1_SPHPE|nr:nucleoside triphosphate pyrophosphohydrolase [Sphingomonas paeninsulae]AYJ85655.1 nucleoside triphosphate pyrophosphohydrolase [Sphingomonas paeninsulae]